MLTMITISCQDCKDPSGSNEKNSQGSYLEEKTEPPTAAIFVTTHETAAKQPDSHHLSGFLPFNYTQQQQQQPPPPESADIFFNSQSKSSSELIPEFSTGISNPILSPPPWNTVNFHQNNWGSGEQDYIKWNDQFLHVPFLMGKSSIETKPEVLNHTMIRAAGSRMSSVEMYDIAANECNSDYYKKFDESIQATSENRRNKSIGT
ncbi:hypothetical protein LXL04_034178 [Taraxacum kok-saghyz]